MSEEILKALMQLFALVTMPGDAENLRRGVVLAFLKKILNSHRAASFIDLFDKFYHEHKIKLSEKEKLPRRIASSSVKALKIASEINEGLTYYQKVIVVIQLIEFLNSSEGIMPVEKEFIDNVAQLFHIDEEDYVSIVALVVSNSPQEVKGDRYLVLASETTKQTQTKSLQWEQLPQPMLVSRLNSANVLLLKFFHDIELTINGQLADYKQIHVLRPGATIRARKCDPLYFSDLQSVFEEKDLSASLVLEVNNLSFWFNKHKIGLQPMSFASSSGNLVGIMGDSGAGKTTLVNVLCGINRPTRGTVTVNGIDIHQNPQKIKGLIGYVSQDDLLIEDLTVYQNLFYNAKLCFDNLTETAIKEKVLKLLDSLGLFEIRDMKVGSPLNKNISGGQRKRLNIALELIREPSVLFLDEPTSGLSSRDSENIVDLLKELSSKGKLVFVVIHQPSSDVFKMFNQLLVLDTGGYLIYNGDALGSIPYFKKCIHHANYEEGECPTCGNVNAEQVLNIVHAKVLDEYGNFTPYRKVEPEEWYQTFNSHTASKEVEVNHGAIPQNTTFKIPSRIKQFWIFLQRDSLSKFANKQYLLINLLEAPFLALLLASLLRYYNVDAGSNHQYVFANNPNMAVYIIVAVIIAFFIGITVSAEEIINDKKILKRESFLNLSRLGYIWSKVCLISVLSAIQMCLFAAIGNYVFGIKGMFWQYWSVLFSTAVFANLLGLVISDTLKKTVNVYILIPFLVIPQLILSGVFVSYDRLNPKLSNPDLIPWYGETVAARWAFEALAVHQFSQNKYQQLFFDDEMVKSQAHYMKEYWVPAIEAKIKELHSPDKAMDALMLLRREFSKDYLHTLKIPFDLQAIENYRTPQNSPHGQAKVYMSVTNKYLNDYLSKVRQFYRLLYNAVDEKIDKRKVALTSTPELKVTFLRLKNEYSNDAFERYLKNADRLFDSKIIEYNHQLIQKFDPIYKDPDNRFMRAHFFAPHKNLLDMQIPTYYANLAVIWVLNALMFVALYFKLFIKAFGLFPYILKRTRYDMGKQGQK